MRKISIIIIGLILFSSCVEKKREPRYEALTDTVSVRSIAVEKELMAPSRMMVMKNNLLIYNRTGDTLFQIFPLPLTGKSHVSLFRGRGPNDLISPDVRGFQILPEGMAVVDGESIRKIFDFDGEKLSLVDSYQIQTKGSVPNGIMELDNGYINISIMNKEKEFEIYAKEGDVTEYIGEYPDWNSSQISGWPAFFYPKTVVVRPDGKKFASFYSTYRAFRIFSSKGVMEKEMVLSYPEPTPIYDPRDPSTRYKTYYTYPVADESVIVAKCDNVLGKNVAENTELQIWSWKGELLHRLIVKQPLDLFTVDFQSGILYAIRKIEMDKIYTVDISPYIR